MATHAIILAWGTQRILAGHSPQGHRMLDTTEVPEHTHTSILAVRTNTKI